MANPLNNVNLVGRLAADPKVFTNSDQSRKVAFTVMVSNDFVTESTGKREAQAIDVEAFISKDRAGQDLGVYGLIHKGDLVAVNASLRSNNYTDKDGKKVYGMTVSVNRIQMLESRSVTKDRQASREQEAPAAPVATPAAAPAAAPVTPEIAALQAQLAAAEAAAQAPFAG